MDLWLWALYFLPGKCPGEALPASCEVGVGHGEGARRVQLLVSDRFSCEPGP